MSKLPPRPLRALHFNIELDFNLKHSTVYVEQYSISSICTEKERERGRERLGNFKNLTEKYKNFK